MKHYSLSKTFLSIIIIGLLGAVLLTACTGVPPKVSYQGRLTDENGTPLNGTFSFTLGVYVVEEGGDPLYTETKDVVVTDGLFDSTLGPSTLQAGLDPEWLTKPLWLQVSINAEVLTPRQQLLGSPYALTLMAGAVVAGELNDSVHGDITGAVLTVANRDDRSLGNPLPALSVQGRGGLEVVGYENSDGKTYAGTIHSLISSPHSDLVLATNDELHIALDADNNSTSSLRVSDGGGADVCTINESGNLHCIGTLTMGGTKSAVVPVDGQQRLLYAIESPEVWFEDFGSGALVNGVGAIAIDPLFAATVNLTDYHVFVTPLGDCQGLYVTAKTHAGFEVHELNGGTANTHFDYRLVAKRLGYEEERLELASPVEEP
ncbi:MAG: hypothetical protein JW987_05095 [Anaerolineaceae bacterium]|nr:hypothetical protein [Anaerolineaceae bacterium]